MLKRLTGALALACLFATPAAAQDKPKSYSVQLTETEIKAVQDFIDLGVKSCGLQCARAAALIDAKLRLAMAPAEAPKVEDKPKP